MRRRFFVDPAEEVTYFVLLFPRQLFRWVVQTEVLDHPLIVLSKVIELGIAILPAE
jgi:hypothetical protein